MKRMGMCAVVVVALYAFTFAFVFRVEAQSAGDRETIQGAKNKQAPSMLQESFEQHTCSWLQSILSALGLFTCNSEQFQNLNVPSPLLLEGKSIPIVDFLSHAAKALSGEQGGLREYFPSMLSGKLPEGNGTNDIAASINEGKNMNLPAMMNQEAPPYVPPPDVLPTGSVPALPPISGTTSPTASSVRVLAKQAGDWAGVPWQIIEAMLIIEGSSYTAGDNLNAVNSGIFGLSTDEIQRFQQPNAKANIYCQPNVCSAAGVMQLTTTGCIPFDTCAVKRNDTTNVNCNSCGAACDYKPSAWSDYKSAVLEANNDGRTPNICNIKDSVFAGAKKMKMDSGSTMGALSEWNQAMVDRVAERYYGSCTPCSVATGGARYACDRLGKTYCDFVWDYYQANKNVQIEPTAVPTQTAGVYIPPNQGQYIVYYQNDPSIASLPLPAGCSIIKAACGPMSALNALSNNGFHFSDPQQFIQTYYPNAGCDGTSIMEGKDILDENNFTTTWVFTSQWAAVADVYSEIKNWTDSGSWVWVVGSFYSVERKEWLGHHFLVVRAANDTLYTLDSYYGYGREIPMDVSPFELRIVAAFAFSKK